MKSCQSVTNQKSLIETVFRLSSPWLASLLVASLLAGCAGAAKSQTAKALVAKDRFDGNWREEKALVGSEYKPQNPQQPIQLLAFDGKKFRLVWHPFEFYYDYWGTYACDQATGKIEFKIDNGNFIPKDFAGKGTYSFDDRGQLILKGVWFGTPRSVQASGDFRGHIFVNRLTLRTSSIHEAAANGQIEVLQQLIRSGADVNQKNEFGMTPLHLAASHGQTAVVRFLCSHGAEIDVRTGGGLTALHLAAITGRFDVSTLLIEAGSDLAARDSGGNTPLHSLLSGNRQVDIEKTVEFFINNGADIHDSRLIPLAAEYSSTNAMNVLLRHGADINLRDKENLTALHRAASKNRAEMVQFLLENGAEVNATGGYANRTPLHEAVDGIEERLPVVKILLDRGANVNVKDSSGTTPLHLAAWFMEKEVVEVLLDKGADLKAKGGWANRTPLHEAADGDDRKRPMVTLLLMKGADVNDEDLNGNTPLHLAVQNDATGIVQTLLEHEAHVLVENEAGKTPLFIAESRKQNEIIAALKVASRFEKVPIKNEVAAVLTIDANQTERIVVAGSGFTPTSNSAQFRNVADPDKIFDINELPSDGTNLVVPIAKEIPAGTYFLKVGAFNSGWSKPLKVIIIRSNNPVAAGVRRL